MIFFKLIFSTFIGVVAYAFAVLLGITSLPSVTAALSWKEFAFIQSKLGWTCLIFAVAHDLFYGWPYINALSCYIPPTFQVRRYFTLEIFSLLTSNTCTLFRIKL